MQRHALRPWWRRRWIAEGAAWAPSPLAHGRRAWDRRRRRWPVALGALGALAALVALVALTPLQATFTQAVLLGPDSLFPVAVPATVAIQRGRQTLIVPVRHGVVASGTLASPALGGRRQPYLAYLPPGYGDRANRGQRYPVLYLLHGAPGQPSDWTNGIHIHLLADELIARGRLRPLIMVMPEGNGGLWHDSQYVDRFDGTFNAATYIARDLVRAVDARYRTVAARDGRAIAGISEGGYGAMNVALTHRGTFGTAISVSGYFRADPREVVGGNDPFGGSAQLMAHNSPLLYAPSLRQGPRTSILILDSVQDGGYARQARLFAARLDSLGIPHTLLLQQAPNALVAHFWPYFRAAAPALLTFVGDHAAPRA